MTTLARLSCWVPAARQAGFAALYERRLAPLLAGHGLAGVPEPGRPAAPGVCSRLLAAGDPAAIASQRQALEHDPAWGAALQSVASGPGSSAPARPLRWTLDPYRVVAGPGRSTAVGAGLRQGLWQSFGVDDGLPVHGITAIRQDLQGNLWLASYGEGVCRYDGTLATTFTVADGLADDRVSSLAEGGQGWWWCGTHSGLSCYDGAAWITYTTADGLADNGVDSLVADSRGRVWCGTAKGLSCYDGRGWITYTEATGLPANQVLGLAEDHQGQLWCGTAKGLSCYDGTAWVTYTTADGLAHDRVSVIAEDRHGRIWCGSWAADPSCWDGRAWTIHALDQGSASLGVLAIAEDQEGHLWFGTHGGGVHQYDGTRVTRFTVADGLANDLVEALGVDQAGDLWVGTGTGISRFRQAQFRTFTAGNGLPSDGATGIGEDRQGGVWFGLFNGRASRYDGTGLTTLELPPPAIASVWAIQEDRQGTLWLGTIESLFAYDGQQFALCPAFAGAAAGCRALLQDRAGNLWAGSGMTWDDQGAGLRRYDGRTWTCFTPADGLASTLVTALAEDRQGRLWVGGGEGALSLYDGRQFSRVEGLPRSTVAALVEDRQGCLWVATWGAGVWRWDGQTFAPLVSAEGSIYPLVDSLVVDQAGLIWMGTWGGGVYIYDGKVLQHLARKDGLVHDGVQALLQDQHGDMWIATEGGVTRYRPRRIPPAVRLADAIADQHYGPVAELEIPVSQRLVAFEFEGCSWTTPSDRMAYVYRLVGFDDAWTTSYRGRAEYHDLPLGEYLFEARAVDRDLNYSTSAQVQVRVVRDPLLEGLSGVLNQNGSAEEFVGNSAAVGEVQRQLAQVMDTGLALLILGETGTGKGLAARLVHNASRRRTGPFIPVTCGALPERLVESELFGHEKGAFTGAVRRRLGKVELARGGTLFLDEVGDLPLEAQAKLLRLLEEYAFERVGGTENLRADVRVIAATNRDLRQMAAQGLFRQDLYFRLKVFEVTLPPLRQRREDIPLLVVYFLERMAAHLNKKMARPTAEALALLQAYDWPGNVRELQHVVERAVVVCPEPAIRAQDLALESRGAVGGPAEPLLPLQEMERRYIRQVLEHTEWVIAGPKGASAILGIPESTLRHRLKLLGLQRQ